MKIILMLLLLVPLPGWSDITPFAEQLAAAALDRTNHRVIYDGRYQSIDYPMGDVAADRGVCTDVVIRSYRTLGIDLQQLVHEDMANSFDAYPALWGLTKPDRNIDHRRVPNLRRFFERHQSSLTVTRDAKNYQEGDIVSWRLDNGRPHIGIVSANKSADGSRPLVVHNIGWGPREDNSLFAYTITGHYRYQPDDG